MMTAAARYRVQMFCAWGGFLYMGVLLLGWALIAGFLPPHRPSAGPQEIAAIFQHDTLRIRIGMLLTMVGAFMVMPFTAILARYIARIEGSPGVLTYSVIMGGGGNMVLTFYPAIFWLVAAFRPDRPPDLIYLLNDWAWLQLIGARRSSGPCRWAWRSPHFATAAPTRCFRAGPPTRRSGSSSPFCRINFCSFSIPARSPGTASSASGSRSAPLAAGSPSPRI